MGSTNKKQLIADTAELWRKISRTLEEKEHSPWLGLSLSRGQLRVLFLLSAGIPMSPGATAAALGVPRANVTDIIERLVRQGLIRRERNPEDRRSHDLCLTEKGREEVERLKQWSTRRIERALETVLEDELKVLQRSLEVMLAAAQRMSEVKPGSRTSADKSIGGGA